MALVHEAKFRVKQILSGLLINGERVKEVFRYCDAPGPLWVLDRRTRGYKEQHKARIAKKIEAYTLPRLHWLWVAVQQKEDVTTSV